VKPSLLVRLVLLTLLAPSFGAEAQTVSTLHSFSTLVTQTNIEGSDPTAPLVLSGNTLYGTTSSGGGAYEGTVFKVKTDGSGYTGLYSFNGGSDGAIPAAGLLQVGDTLYGTTEEGGISNNGTIFAINTDGSGYTNLYSFSALDTNFFNNDGAHPASTLILVGDMLYGTAESGGTNGSGTIFALSTNGSIFTNIHNFTGGNGGASPAAGLVASNGVLYGTSSSGGASYEGTVFSINTDGSGFTNIYDFTGASDGASPQASLVLSGNWLYGTAASGGQTYNGAVFAVTTNGSVFTNLHSFAGGVDGGEPEGSLLLLGDVLYGTAPHGGTWSNGTVFAINIDGSGFTNVYSFSELNSNFDNADGEEPVAGLIASGNTLFGTAQFGGHIDFGTVFSLSTNGTTFSTLVSLDPYVDGLVFSGNDDGSSPQGGVVLSGSTLYGTAVNGGAFGDGTLFSVQTNGSNFTTLHSFTSQADGSYPLAGLILSGDTLYGATEFGGNGTGVIFSIETNGSDFTVIYTFSPLIITNFELVNSDGYSPLGNLLLAGNVLYGTTENGGANGKGTVFAVTTDGLHFTNLHDFSAVGTNFDNSDGANPVAGLVLYSNTLYGVAKAGGSNGFGTVFSVGADGSNFTTLYTFTGSADGSAPSATLFLTNGVLYGTTPFGGVGAGTIFGIDPSGSNFTTVYSLSGQGDGTSPSGGLVGDQVFVPTSFGGANFAGTIFTMNLNGTPIGGTSLPGGTGGSYPNGEMGLAGDGTVFVAARQGGAAGNGAILAVAPAPNVSATLTNASGNVTIANGGSGSIDAPVNTLFNYSFYVNSNMNPNSISVVGVPPSGLSSPSYNGSGVWSIGGDFTQSGTFPVTFEVQDGANAYFYTLNIIVCNPPTITNVVAADTNAMVSPGSQIVITGTGLSSATQVLFNYPSYGDSNAVAGTNLQINSDNQITVTVPEGAETAPIGVITDCGYVVTTPAVIIGNLPTITASSPAYSAGVFSFEVTGPPGTYTFQSSTDLVNWTNVYTVLSDKVGDAQPRKLSPKLYSFFHPASPGGHMWMTREDFKAWVGTYPPETKP
jgi:uncharacterized repeat protein (TIGR03803 family)